MKKLLVLFTCILILTACGNFKRNLTKKITNENLSFIGNVENICDTDLDVQNKLILLSIKDNKGNYKGSYELYDCGDESIYMTEGEGTYKLDGNIIVFSDQYDNKTKFKVKNGSSIVQIDDNKNQIRKLKLETTTKSE